MGVGQKLLTNVVVAAAVARGRRRAPGSDRGAVDPYPGEPRAQAGRQQAGQQQAGQQQGATSGAPGVDADKPTELGKAGWKQVVKRAWKETKDDNVPLLAAGVAFYAFLALFPGLIAMVTLYGLVADPATVQDQIESISRALPPETATLIADQLREITSTDSGSLGVGLVVSLLAALFSASGGVQNMMKAINLAYDEKETRGFLKLRGTALLLTLGAVVFLVVAVGLVAVVPVVFDALSLGVVGTFFGQVARWAALVAFVVVALAVLYRYAPDRDNARLEWVGVGSIAATVLWVVGSAGFSLYVSNFGKYGKTYGALAGVVVLLLWLFLTSYIVLFGAEVNAEAERQTAKDTTEGPERALGERRAVAADTVAAG
ncbi:MAG: ribonuclease [Frankiales bacterium]|nr:ribonuclease [Frankiales bacterium]